MLIAAGIGGCKRAGIVGSNQFDLTVIKLFHCAVAQTDCNTDGIGAFGVDLLAGRFAEIVRCRVTYNDKGRSSEIDIFIAGKLIIAINFDRRRGTVVSRGGIFGLAAAGGLLSTRSASRCTGFVTCCCVCWLTAFGGFRRVVFAAAGHQKHNENHCKR